MIDRLYYASRKIQERCENSFVDYQELQNKLRKALLFNEATYDIFKLNHCVYLYYANQACNFGMAILAAQTTECVHVRTTIFTSPEN